ncbi:MAG TPA: sigma-54 dependent transcriptional regulator [Bacteroidales bacterium]|nr:sigma-54 dependent transcriptional regulator [Bacteroidales bacterium]HQH18893.1 sigma-54 dependent transcriptional regulator [Bacteroidales bacterium]HQI45931.1 sigma-54 dependent transcriptional regulator [Bacteroidales bacterium]
MDIQSIKQRFGIIGNSPLLNRAIDIASQVAPTEITVLIYGESGTGKEVFPKIIHQLSARKHGPFIAVNCGAIPEGTIDSELFGHEKGSFTGAHEARKGYFEVVNKGSIFLDEVADLPLSTQARLLRVLETGEFMKVGSSNVLKTDVRVVAASNIFIPDAIRNNRFREDLYYRLNTVPIFIPPLRERKEDILLLFRKFASDFAEKYRMPAIQLDEEAQRVLENYRWPGNIRQLKNITEQISIIENTRILNGLSLQKYLPQQQTNDLPVVFKGEHNANEISERDLLYKILFDMKKDISELKKIVFNNIDQAIHKPESNDEKLSAFNKLEDEYDTIINNESAITIHPKTSNSSNEPIEDTEIIEESLSLHRKEEDMIRKALEKHNRKRKNAAKDLGISERTLYRKIKEYGIE